jgi:ferredoxin-fold anticodon binding domain-containing protein
MKPFSEIKIWDVYSNPMHRGFGELSGPEYVVLEKNETEKLIKVQPIRFSDGKPIGKPFWKKNTDRIFSEDWFVENIDMSTKKTL